MGGQNAVDIEIYGFDFGRTDAVAAELAERMRKVKGCSQVNISREDYIPEYQVDFDRETALPLPNIAKTVTSMT